MSKAAAVLAHEKGYRITESGEIMSFTGEMIRGWVGNDGYVQFSVAGKRGAKCAVHRLVAYQKFGGDYLERGIVARHMDSNPKNNSRQNIEIGTASDNSMDRPKEQRVAMAAAAARKFTDEEIAEWRRLNSEGVPYRKLQVQFNIPKSTLSYYLSRKAKKASFVNPAPIPSEPS